MGYTIIGTSMYVMHVCVPRRILKSNHNSNYKHKKNIIPSAIILRKNVKKKIRDVLQRNVQ